MPLACVLAVGWIVAEEVVRVDAMFVEFAIKLVVVAAFEIVN